MNGLTREVVALQRSDVLSIRVAFVVICVAVVLPWLGRGRQDDVTQPSIKSVDSTL